MEPLDSMRVVFIIVTTGLLILLRRWVCKRYENPRSLPLPPGPPPLPVVGNLFDVPSTEAWLTYSSFAQQYGDIIHLKVLSQHVVVVSSLEVASDLFDRRAPIYSDRFQSTMMTDLIDMGWSFGFFNYGEPLRRSRKLFHQHYGSTAIRQFDALQSEITRTLLKRLLGSPKRFFDHSRFAFASLILSISYGLEIQDETNEHVVESEAWMEGFNKAIQPGRYWVDGMPLLKYVPSWLPGAGFKRLAFECREHMYKARDRPFNLAKENLTNGVATHSVATNALEMVDEELDATDQELFIRDTLAAAFGAAVDTSSPTLQIFFYAMMIYPHIQEKAQEQLDKVVGPNRLPTIDDRPNLLYVEAILKETLRWKPVTPFALPHYTATSDEYRGYYIPKETVVLGNVWRILHDPSLYPNPDQFLPERFIDTDGALNPKVPDPSIACFGFGRRICPGRFLSLDSLFNAMASILHTFDIKPKIDDDGKPIVPALQMHSGLICHPKEFPCAISVRSPVAEALIVE